MNLVPSPLHVLDRKWNIDVTRSCRTIKDPTIKDSMNAYMCSYIYGAYGLSTSNKVKSHCTRSYRNLNSKKRSWGLDLQEKLLDLRL